MKTSVVFFVAALAAVCCMAGNDECKPEITSSDGNKYVFDLTSLHHAPGAQDTLVSHDSRPGQNQDYYINICGEVTMASDNQCAGASVCQKTQDDVINAGSFRTQEFASNKDGEPGKDLIVKYGEGKQCNSGPIRSTTIYFDCDTSALTPHVEPVQEVSGCTYVIHIKTKYACGVRADSVSGGGDTAALVILLILLGVVLLYFGLGVVYQIKVKGASTPREYIIHNEFWCAIPGMIKDGVLFITHGCKKGDYVGSI